jgi:hypothetical protein
VPEPKRPERVLLSHKLNIYEVPEPVGARFEADQTESVVVRDTVVLEQPDVNVLSQAMVEAVGRSFAMSFSVAEWVDCLGGYVGELTDPDDPTFVYPLSLDEWRSRDPERTWLRIVAVVQYRHRGPGLGHTGRSRKGRPPPRSARVHSVRVLRPGT